MVMSASRKFVHDMALSHKWIKEAQQEFESTLDYVLCEFGEQSVRKVYTEVSSRIKLLQTHPNAGMRYRDLSYRGNEVRISHMKKSSIIYCYDDETLYILAFWNNRSDDSVIADILSAR